MKPSRIIPALIATAATLTLIPQLSPASADSTQPTTITASISTPCPLVLETDHTFPHELRTPLAEAIEAWNHTLVVAISHTDRNQPTPRSLRFPTRAIEIANTAHRGPNVIATAHPLAGITLNPSLTQAPAEFQQRIIAHEIGHLLGIGHTESGLMGATHGISEELHHTDTLSALKENPITCPTGNETTGLA